MFSWTDCNGTTHEVDIAGATTYARCFNVRTAQWGEAMRAATLLLSKDHPITCLTCIAEGPGRRKEATFALCDRCGTWWHSINGQTYASSFEEANRYETYTILNQRLLVCERCRS